MKHKTIQTLTVLGILFIIGCGGNTSKAPVVKWEGTVTVGGEPLPTDLTEAYIIVRPADSQELGMGSPVQASVENGKYKLDAVPKGNVTVQFLLNRKTGKKIKEPMSGQLYDETVNLVPAAKCDGIPIQATGDNPRMDFDL